MKGEKMKELYLLRHAKSDWDDDSISDHERPLNKRGFRDAPAMGNLMKREGMVLSPAQRSGRKPPQNW